MIAYRARVYNSRVSRGALHCREVTRGIQQRVARRPLARWMMRWLEIASLCSLSREIILHYGRVPREDALTHRKVDPRRARSKTYRCQLFQFPSRVLKITFPSVTSKDKVVSLGLYYFDTNFSISKKNGQLDACQAVKSSIFQTEISFSLYYRLYIFFIFSLRVIIRFSLIRANDIFYRVWGLSSLLFLEVHGA